LYPPINVSRPIENVLILMFCWYLFLCTFFPSLSDWLDRSSNGSSGQDDTGTIFDGEGEVIVFILLILVYLSQLVLVGLFLLSQIYKENNENAATSLNKSRDRQGKHDCCGNELERPGDS
jgi:hypothetical protein